MSHWALVGIGDKGMMSTDKVLAVVLIAGLIFVVGHAQSRFDKCRALGQKNIDCVLSFD